MTPTAVQAAALTAVAIVCVLALHRLPNRIRLAFDLVCFGAASLLLHSHSAFPFFQPVAEAAGNEEVWLRAVGAAWWLLGAHLAVAAIRFILNGNKRSRGARLVGDLATAAIYLVAGGIVLNSVFALPVTGVVATSGVVAVVLGLALQSTLADLFAGIAVSIEAPFSVGDRVQIGDKIEGLVIQANWRSIRVQTDGDDVAIIPNSSVAKADIIKQSVPSPRRIVAVEISCPEHAIPERVTAALLEATLLCPNILKVPAPQATLAHLGSRRHLYKVSFVVANSGQVGGTRDRLLRAARRQLRYAGLLENNGISACLDPATRLLRDLILFESLTTTQIEGVAGLMQLRRLGPGDVLFIQGAEDGFLYVVLTGIVELTRQVGAVSETIGSIGAGEYIGEIGLLTAVPHAATATARTNAEIHLLPRTALAPLLSDNATLASAFDQSMRRGLEILNREVAVRATPTIGVREHVLLRVRQIFGLQQREG